RVLRATPPEKLEWRHTAGVFSMGDLARHLAATERYTFAENVFGRPSLYQGCGTDLADGLDNVVAFLERTRAETVAMLAGLDLESRGITPQGKPAPVGALLRAMIEHEIHHRGEMYVYLALMGVERPPLFGVT